MFPEEENKDVTWASFINAKFPCTKFITYRVLFQDSVNNEMEILDINGSLVIIFILRKCNNHIFQRWSEMTDHIESSVIDPRNGECSGGKTSIVMKEGRV